VYDIMTARIGEWWVDPYRLLDGSELFLELELGGRIYERAGQRFVSGSRGPPERGRRLIARPARAWKGPSPPRPSRRRGTW
jgi:hypothetical protein